VRAEFVFNEAPFASARASTIAESRGALVAAWFGGPYEGHAEVGIWLACREGERWSAPVEVAQGRDRRGRQSPC
jgi:predicted neuraminidase